MRGSSFVSSSSAFGASQASLLRRELVSSATPMRGAPALSGDLALPDLIHRGETPTTAGLLPIFILILIGHNVFLYLCDEIFGKCPVIKSKIFFSAFNYRHIESTATHMPVFSNPKNFRKYGKIPLLVMIQDARYASLIIIGVCIKFRYLVLIQNEWSTVKK